jgi:hypothetical protein
MEKHTHSQTALAFVLQYLHSVMPTQTTTLVDSMRKNPSCIASWYKYIANRASNYRSHYRMHNSFVSSFPHGKIIRILPDDDNGDDDGTDDECISPITLPNKLGATAGAAQSVAHNHTATAYNHTAANTEVAYNHTAANTEVAYNHAATATATAANTEVAYNHTTAIDADMEIAYNHTATATASDVDDLFSDPEVMDHVMGFTYAGSVSQSVTKTLPNTVYYTIRKQ